MKSKRKDVNVVFPLQFFPTVGEDFQLFLSMEVLIYIYIYM